MTARIEVQNLPGVTDAAGESVRRRIASDLGIGLDSVRIVEVYAVDKDLPADALDRCRTVIFTDPLSQESSLDRPLAAGFDWAVEVGFLPGVTDNVGNTSREAVRDLLKTDFASGENVYSSRQYLLSGAIGRPEAERIAGWLHNPLIERVALKGRDEFERDGGAGMTPPIVHLAPSDRVDEIDLEVSDEELTKLGREGVLDHVEDDREVRRGPLAMDLDTLRVIREYFRQEGRKPTDVEIEALAQTWSEHCKHTIFAAQLDEVDGVFKSLIRAATREVRERLAAADFCVSVFSDNSGVIRLNDDWDVCYKVETHNSPSALDPYGGAITGIVGVNRDPMGTGQGAMLVANMYGFCFGDPNFSGELFYRGRGRKNPILHPKVIFEGVRRGVEHGGNKSGIPTPAGFIIFDKRYMGKPLVFVGTVGLLPHRLNGRGSWEKKARPGDHVVMAGGRVGKDGIHGATFSSESLHEGSPASAVQIGDPITQKKMHDAQLEARNLDLYDSVTDNGAGGLSSSVGEMARECGGVEVELDQVPIKYAGLLPSEIWISESQERMSYSVPPDKLDRFMAIMRRHDVEAVVIGKFTDNGRCRVTLHGRPVLDLDLDFMHDGLPKQKLRSAWEPPALLEPKLVAREDYSSDLVAMVGRLNLCSREYVVRQYDHEVQAGSVVKPLVGVGQDVHQDATVTQPLYDRPEGFALASALHPWYGDIEPAAMAEAGIDSAVRAVVAVGADPSRVAILDNFCWCSSTEPFRLAQLKRAGLACYQTATEFLTPFVSGKDSMFNDFKGFDGDDNPVKVSVPPTLLISSIGIVPDVKKCVTIDPKAVGDLVYVLGVTRDELGGSEYYAYRGETEEGERYVGARAPRIGDARALKDRYQRLAGAIARGLVASAAPVGPGGLAYTLAKMAMAGECGLALDFAGLPRESQLTDDKVLFSESLGRLALTVAPRKRAAFEAALAGEPLDLVGKVSASGKLQIRGVTGGAILDVGFEQLKESYKKTLGW